MTELSRAILLDRIQLCFSCLQYGENKSPQWRSVDMSRWSTKELSDYLALLEIIMDIDKPPIE